MPSNRVISLSSRGVPIETQIVAETADDAALSKLSAARLGYVNDPFIPMFVPSNRPQRRSPLINRGYFSRVAVVDLILQRFVATCRRTGDGRSQVISLGAGMDTTFFRCYAAAFLSSQSSSGGGGGGATSSSSSSSQQVQQATSQSSPSPTSGVPTVYYEVDFADVTAKKASIVRKSPVLQKCIDGRTITAADIASIPAFVNSSSTSFEPNSTLFTSLHPLSPSKVVTSTDTASSSSSSPSITSSTPLPVFNLPAPRIHADIKYEVQDSGGCNLIGKSYRLVTSDLRDISAVETALLSAGCDFSLPTLLLSECVLIYLEPEESCGIIAWAARAFSRSMFVTYEQIRPHDAFGQMMMRNLEERGYKLRGLNAFPDLNSQIARYTELGYQACTSIDMNDVYYRLLPRAEVARIERLEIFDELEEWHLMSAHYSITVACNELNGMPPQRRGGKSGSSKQQQQRSSAAAPAQNSPSILQSISGNNTPKPGQDDSNPTSVEVESPKTDDIHHKNAANVATSRVSIRTEMPAPMRKMPRTSSYSGGPGSSFLQSQVNQQAIPPASPSSVALPSFQPATFPNSSLSSSTAVFSSRVASNDVFQQQQQRSGRAAGALTTADSAKELAIHVVQSHQLANNSSSSSSLLPSLHRNGECSSPDAHLGGEGGGGGFLSNTGHGSRSGSRSRSRSRSITTDSSDVDVGGSSGRSHSQIRVHTHTPVDFEAMAEAEDELLHARHAREAAGIDLQRETDLGRILPVGGTSTSNSCSASVVSDRDGDDGGDLLSTPIIGHSGSAFPAAVEGSKKLTSPFSPWTAQAIISAAREGQSVSLLDCLFPSWQTRN